MSDQPFWLPLVVLGLVAEAGVDRPAHSTPPQGNQIRLDEMIKFNQMIITSIQPLSDMPDQPLWLPLV